MKHNTDRKHETPPLADQLTDADVASYLEARPDFFIQNRDILSILAIPQRDDVSGVSDFQGYANQALRQKLLLLEGVQDDLTGIIRDNIRAQETIHAAVLAALDAKTREEFLHSVLQRWTDILDIEAIALGLTEPIEEKLKSGNLSVINSVDISERFDTPNDDRPGSEPQDAVFLNLDGDEPLFGPAAPLVKSCVLLRLRRDNQAVGILALGWRTRDGFGPGRGTETLYFLSRALCSMLTRWQEANENASPC